MARFTSLSPRWLLVAAALLLIGWLHYAPLWNPDEGRYASASLEMMGGLQGEGSNWVVPHLNTIPRLNKPPLIYWTSGASFKLFGPSEWAARLGPALAALSVMLMVWSLGRAMFDENTGISGALIWSSSILAVALGRTCNTDMLLCAGTTAVCWGIWQAATFEKPNWHAYITAGIGMGVAMLSKGPVGVALPLLIGLIYLFVARVWRRVNWPGFALSFALGALIAAPWFLAVEKTVPGFTKQFIVTENLGRFSGQEEFHAATPFYYYLPVLLAGLLPWTAYAGMPFVRLKMAQAPVERRNLWFLWLWAATIVLLFSKSSTKLPSYILPAFPSLALLLAHGILTAARSKRPVMLVFFWVIIFSTLGALGVYLLNDNTVPRWVGLPYVIAGTLALLVPGALITKFWLAHEPWKVIITQFVGSLALYACLFSFAGRLSAYEDASAMFRAVRPYLTDDTLVMQTGSFQPSAIFYMRRPISFVNFSNTSGLDDKALAASPYFFTLKKKDATGKSLDLGDFFARKQPVFVLLRWRGDHYSVPHGVFTWARNNDYKLISNRPRPAQFHFDFTAPRKARLDTNPAQGPPPNTSPRP